MAGVSWYQTTVTETLRVLVSDSGQGLDNVEANKRQAVYQNQLEQGARVSPVNMMLAQFTDTMVLVLLGATIVSGVVGDMADAITIMAIVIINAALGFIQEYRAERSLEEIKKLASPYALVIREGKKQKIPAVQLVPGDIVLLEAGDKVPADLRLVESYNLEADEAALTGESVPVEKNAVVIYPGEVPIAEQSNMAFMGTAITRGRSKAVVVATGMQTVMGQIAAMMKETDKEPTPLQIRLDQLGKILIIICLAVCSVVTLLGIIRGEEILTMFMAGVSLAVAAIPEGLPAIVTVVLALGVQRMARRNAIVRKLPAVETLGCTTIICSDKTGTLTQNKMTVKKVATLDQIMDVTGSGYDTKGKFLRDGKMVDPLKDKGLQLLIKTALNCNNSSLHKTNGESHIQGDPTEGALLVMARKAGLKEAVNRIREIPFDSDRKRMSVVAAENDRCYLYSKGALDVLINSCTRVVRNGSVTVLTEADKRKLYTWQEEWADNALRVLGFACRNLSSREASDLADEQLESELILIGICGIIDPPREGVAKSVQECLAAGITPIMITGDHPKTARAIATEIGITKSRGVINGIEIDHLSDNELYRRAISERVFARVSPQHKNRIVKVLKTNRHVVAMTGDGVNDAPAIKAADIGIAMGITGTEVTKEASAMILADDDFSTIVKAVYEGRAIYDNIRKFIRYLLGCNIGEVLVMFLASLMGMPLPLLPIQILWVNLVTDGLPAMALGLEPPEPEIMKRRPRPRDEGIFARQLGWIIFSRGLYIGVITLAVFTIGLIYCRFSGISGLEVPRTMALTTLVFAQLFYVFECRSERFSPFQLGIFSNRYLVAAVLCSITMQLFAIYLPFFQQIFKTAPLLPWQWLLIILVSGIKFIWKYALFAWESIFAKPLNYAKINH